MKTVVFEPVSRIAEIYLGGTPSRNVPGYWGGSVLWASAGDVAGSAGRYLFGTAESITSLGLDKSAAKLLQRGTIVITARGTVGAIRQLGQPMTFNQTCYGIVAKSGIDQDYLYYALKSVLGELSSLVYGTVFDTITKKTFESLEVPVPPLAEQRAIAHILGSLDDKIELNRRMNRTLEEIARTLFKSWFVDFDPVHAKARGESPAGLDAATAALFPASFEESELGLIPKGWRVASILDFAERLSGGTPKTSVAEYWNGDIAWVSARDVKTAEGTFIIDTEKHISRLGVENSSTRILPKGTTIVTARGTVGAYCILAEEMAMNQTNYGLKTPADYGDYFVFLSLGNAIAWLRQNTHGTIFDTITTQTLERMNIVLPPERLIRIFEVKIAPVMELAKSNIYESRTLAELRDTLLPRLMSGELRVPGAVR